MTAIPHPKEKSDAGRTFSIVRVLAVMVAGTAAAFGAFAIGAPLIAATTIGAGVGAGTVALFTSTHPHQAR